VREEPERERRPSDRRELHGARPRPEPVRFQRVALKGQERHDRQGHVHDHCVSQVEAGLDVQQRRENQESEPVGRQRGGNRMLFPSRERQNRADCQYHGSDGHQPRDAWQSPHSKIRHSQPEVPPDHRGYKVP